MESNHYDLVIVGGGASGLSLLLGLYPYLESGYIKSVLLIEKDQETKPLPGRSIALNQNTLNYFKGFNFGINNEQFNALNYLASNLKPIKNILVKNKGYSQSLLLEAKQHHQDQFGGVIDLHILQEDLTNLAKILQQNLPAAKIDIWLGHQVCQTKINYQNKTRELLIKNEQQEFTVTTNLAVIANGAKFINGLERYNTTLKQVEHQQYGIIADVELSAPLNDLAIEYFTPHGPVAFLPKSDYQFCIVWCTNQQQNEQAILDNSIVINNLNEILEQIGDRELDNSVNRKFYHDQKLKLELPYPGQNNGNKYYIKSYSKMTSFPLNAQLQTKLNDVNLVYIGNAAHTLHPVSGQGFNLGLLSITSLLQAIANTQKLDNEQSFAQQANLIAQEYAHLHAPIANEVFNRTNLLATEFSERATFGKLIPNLGLYHLINYPFLQDLIVSPSLGYVNTNQLSLAYKILHYLQAI